MISCGLRRLERDMKTIDHIREFLDSFVNWTSAREDVQAVALVGSYARDEARDDSDIDFVILTSQPENYLEDLKWMEHFGPVEKYQTEDYGKLTSVRVWYQNGVEVEYGFTKGEPPTWRNLSHYLSQSFAAIRMSSFSFFLAA